jgi:sterol desaturase/sphingolipid hydroxylase (fatty acid hydroxylase superfamily)
VRGRADAGSCRPIREVDVVDLTVAAVPFFYGTMAAEAYALERQRRAGRPDGPGDYTWPDTLASLSMGVASLVVPTLTRKVFRKFEVGRGRLAPAVLGVAGAAAVATVVADAVARAGEHRAAGGAAGQIGDGGGASTTAAAPGEAESVGPGHEGRGRRVARAARRVAGSTAVTAIASAGVAVTGTWAARTAATRLFPRRVLPDLGNGPLAVAVATLGWDFIYYWNHRFQHESRFLWAMHVVHHSSERYNLSTALRQPVAESLILSVPYGLLALLGIRPDVIETARGINLIYQYWIHTETIRSLGPLEQVLNTASHHRVHHGSQRQYLDRNHGSILIVWDRLFGTFEPEDERVVYGLTTNIDTYNPLRIASHEYAAIGHDVASARTWRDRVSHVVRGPGWRPAPQPGATSMRPEAAASANAA